MSDAKPVARNVERLAWRVSEMAEALGISRTAAYELVRRGPPGGGVRVVRLGRAIRVPHAELERLLEAQPDDSRTGTE